MRLSTYVFREVKEKVVSYRVDVRYWYQRKRDDVWVATKKGIYFDIEHLGAMIAKLARLYDRYKKQTCKASKSKRR